MAIVKEGRLAAVIATPLGPTPAGPTVAVAVTVFVLVSITETVPVADAVLGT
ncbi:hypothetical protein ABT288_00355 [Streptomyces sp. NPDC001093]|uniref:hypothetical protein n=1 Tax=Streptomyces sp. NPDC001093 TaxID=3154376 RepID=UPI00331FA664